MFNTITASILMLAPTHNLKNAFTYWISSFNLWLTFLLDPFDAAQRKRYLLHWYTVPNPRTPICKARILERPLGSKTKLASRGSSCLVTTGVCWGRRVHQPKLQRDPGGPKRGRVLNPNQDCGLHQEWCTSDRLEQRLPRLLKSEERHAGKVNI